MGNNRNTRKPSKSSNVSCHCGKPDHEASVGCTKCDSWIHFECLGDFTVEELSRLITDKPGNYVCKICLPSLTSEEAEEFKKHSQRGELYIWKAPATPSPLTQTGELTQEALNQIVAVAVQTAAKSATDAAMDFCREYMEKEKRANNLVIVGLPEKEDSEMAQRHSDTAKVESYCDKLGIPKESIQSTFREGRTAGKTVVKVCFKDRYVTERRLMLSRGTNLLRRDPDLEDCRFKPFMRPDLTEKERARDFALREELKKRREEPGNHNLIIRGGRIVTRRPPAWAPGNAVQPGDQ